MKTSTKADRRSCLPESLFPIGKVFKLKKPVPVLYFSPVHQRLLEAARTLDAQWNAVDEEIKNANAKGRTKRHFMSSSRSSLHRAITDFLRMEDDPSSAKGLALKIHFANRARRAQMRFVPHYDCLLGNAADALLKPRAKA